MNVHRPHPTSWGRVVEEEHTVAAGIKAEASTKGEGVGSSTRAWGP